MNRTKLLTIAVIGLLLLNLGTMSVMLFHKPPRPPFGEGPPRNGEGPKRLIIERLHFDDAQQKQYEGIIEEHRSKTMELNTASRTMHNELYSMLKNDAIDNAKRDLIIQEIADNQKAIDNLNFDHFQKIKNICKPDQLKDFNDLAEELSELFGPKGPPPR